MRLSDPKFSKGAVVRDGTTGVQATVEIVTDKAHPKTGERLYLVVARTGRPRHIQEQHLRFWN